MVRSVLRCLVCALAGWLAQPAVAAIVTAAITPEPLPDPHIAGFRFPESEAALTRWITTYSRSDDPAQAAAAFEAIHLHGWGLWAAVTAETNQSYGGQKLRVFETWLTPDDLGDAAPASEPLPAPHARALLRPVMKLRTAPEQPDRPEPIDPEPLISRVVGFTKFDPTAAAHIQRQELLNASALNVLLDAGAQQIPPFPTTAMAVKPVFQVLAAKSLVAGRYYRLKAWPGPPDTPQPWSPAQWPGCVWLDLAGGGEGRGTIDNIAAEDGSSRTAETTYPVSALLNYRLTAEDAVALNAAKPGTDASAGDYAILVAMHVSSREIARWTWQTFWWSPTPADPHAPSSVAIAALRPEQLRGAARNYAMSLGYALLAPDQPYTGGTNRGAALYAYNPWIEARIASTDLPDSQPGATPDGRAAANNVGVQTSCMSCHVRANYNPLKLATAPRFAGARYTDLIDPQFVGTLQVDFLWSIARHAK